MVHCLFCSFRGVERSMWRWPGDVTVEIETKEYGHQPDHNSVEMPPFVVIPKQAKPSEWQHQRPFVGLFAFLNFTAFCYLTNRWSNTNSTWLAHMEFEPWQQRNARSVVFFSFVSLLAWVNQSTRQAHFVCLASRHNFLSCQAQLLLPHSTRLNHYQGSPRCDPDRSHQSLASWPNRRAIGLFSLVKGKGKEKKLLQRRRSILADSRPGKPVKYLTVEQTVFTRVPAATSVCSNPGSRWLL